MTIGSGIAVAGAFIGTSLAFLFGAEVSGVIFIAPAVATLFVAMANSA